MKDILSDFIDRYHLTEETSLIIKNEELLPVGLLNRLHSNYPEHSALKQDNILPFNKHQYSGINGFREIVKILNNHAVDIGHIQERELFIYVYRFMATKHVLNAIDWQNFENDSIFQLVFPQPGMMEENAFKKYQATNTEEERQALIDEYIKHNTNPHDGNQQLNKPWYENEEGELAILEGSQHKYSQCQLIFDKTTQNCFSFCTYCFRHAQVRGDEDMFNQVDIKPVHDYVKKHKEITDMLITGGDGGYMPYNRLKDYMQPLIDEPELSHIKSFRIGSRALTFHPEMFLTKEYTKKLELFKSLANNGIQVVWMSHFSTPKELLNPLTIAAIRRLRLYGVVIKSQSPIMNHISLFTDEKGKVDVDKSAQNWIDLGNIFAMLSVGFHSMYCARPTGEHHYFTVSLADINKVFNKVYRSLPSINRPSRYITMTSSGGKISILGTVDVKGEKAFALKFNEARNMEWMDEVFLAKYDEETNTVIELLPFEGNKYFYEDELKEIEKTKQDALDQRIKKN